MENFENQEMKPEWVNVMIENEKMCLDHHRDLVSEIKRIPHLPLDLSINLSEIALEATEILTLRPHELHAEKELPKWYYEHHRKSFRGQCLIDYTPHGDNGMVDTQGYLFEQSDAVADELGRLRFFKTPWGDKFPRTLQALGQMSPYLNRTRVIRTPPGGGIFWHSHHNGIYRNQYLRLAVVILTIESNEQCHHGVRDYRDDKSQPHIVHYEPGVPYLFNSWHDHDFWNRGQTDRLTIICYMNFPDHDFLKFLGPQVDRYRGSRLELDER